MLLLFAGEPWGGSMGVEYRYLLIPRDNTHRPDPAAIERLIEAWRSRRFAVRAGSPQLAAMDFSGDSRHASAAATGALLRTSSGSRPFGDADIGVVHSGDLLVQWPVANAHEGGLLHPLGLVDEGNGTYFDLELRFSDDFVFEVNEMIDPMDARCDACGDQLEYEPDFESDIFYASRVSTACPACRKPFRPQDHVAVFRDGMTGVESDLQGGATYRFAIVVDCGKCWRAEASADSAAPVATEEFLSTSSAALGVPLYAVGYFY